MIGLLVSEVFSGGQLDDLYDPSLAERARAWIGPFRNSFTDLDTGIVDLVAEGETVAARFVCSGTHTGDGLGHPPTGQRFRRVPEVYFSNHRRPHQQGLGPGRHLPTTPPTWPCLISANPRRQARPIGS